MDENLFESVQYAAWVFLFIFALSFGLYQYGRIDAVIEQFIGVNMFNDRGTGTGVFLDESEIEREASRAEVIMSILNLPDTVVQAGNEEYYVAIKNGGTNILFTYTNLGDGEHAVSVSSTSSPFVFFYVIQGVSASSGVDGPKELITDLKNAYLSGSTYATKYRVTYYDDGIIYEKK